MVNYNDRGERHAYGDYLPTFDHGHEVSRN